MRKIAETMNYKRETRESDESEKLFPRGLILITITDSATDALPYIIKMSAPDDSGLPGSLKEVLSGPHPAVLGPAPS